MDEEKRCDCCGEIIDEDDEYEVLEDGTTLCSSCFENEYEECAMCGEIRHVDDMSWWGDCRICSDCLEEQCPSFDGEENEKETAQAYEAMKAKYLGRKSARYADRTVTLTYDLDEPCVRYSLPVTFDKNGVITDIARLTARMILSEGITSSDTRPYAVDEEDYGWRVDAMFDDEAELEE